MNEYRAIYKCRLCGEEFEGISFDDKDEWLSFAMDGFAQGCDSVEIKRDGEKVFVSVNAEHGCKDGSMGLADFLGFQKVEDGNEPD